MPKRICEKCGAPCSQKNGYMGVKPEASKPKKWKTKYICFHCKHLLGGLENVEKFFEQAFKEIGFEGRMF